MWEFIGKLAVFLILIQVALMTSPLLLAALALYGGYMLLSGNKVSKKEE